MELKRTGSYVGIRCPHVYDFGVIPLEEMFERADNMAQTYAIEEDFKETYPGYRMSDYIIALREQGYTHAVWFQVSPEDVLREQPQTGSDFPTEFVDVVNGELLTYTNPEGMIVAVRPNEVTTQMMSFWDATQQLKRRQMDALGYAKNTGDLRTFGYLIHCTDDKKCDIVRGVARWSNDEEEGAGYYDFRRVRDGTFIGNDDARLAIAERIRDTLHRNVAVQLSNSLALFDQYGAIESVFAPTRELCRAELENLGVATDALYMGISEGCVCLPSGPVNAHRNVERDVPGLWGFQYISYHPIATAILRARYPLYEPTDLKLIGIASLTYAGVMLRRSLTPCLSTTWLHLLGFLVATDLMHKDDALRKIVQTIVHEAVHRAEAMSGIPYVGNWLDISGSFHPPGPAIAVGSEKLADIFARMAEEAIVHYDWEEASSRVADDFEYYIESAKKSPDYKAFCGVIKYAHTLFYSDVAMARPEERKVRIALTGVRGPWGGLDGFLTDAGITFYRDRWTEGAEITLSERFARDMLHNAPSEVDYEGWRKPDF